MFNKIEILKLIKKEYSASSPPKMYSDGTVYYDTKLKMFRQYNAAVKKWVKFTMGVDK